MVRERVSALVIVDRKLLMVLDSNSDVFYTPGGGVESGEDHIIALNREMDEELGVKINNISYLLSFDHINHVTLASQRDHCYLVDMIGKPVPQEDIIRSEWISRREIENGLVKTQDALRQYLLPKLAQKVIF